MIEIQRKYYLSKLNRTFDLRQIPSPQFRARIRNDRILTKIFIENAFIEIRLMDDFDREFPFNSDHSFTDQFKKILKNEFNEYLSSRQKSYLENQDRFSENSGVRIITCFPNKEDTEYSSVNILKNKENKKFKSQNLIACSLLFFLVFSIIAFYLGSVKKANVHEESNFSQLAQNSSPSTISTIIDETTGNNADDVAEETIGSLIFDLFSAKWIALLNIESEDSKIKNLGLYKENRENDQNKKNVLNGKISETSDNTGLQLEDSGSDIVFDEKQVNDDNYNESENLDTVFSYAVDLYISPLLLNFSL